MNLNFCPWLDFFPLKLSLQEAATIIFSILSGVRAFQLDHKWPVFENRKALNQNVVTMVLHHNFPLYKLLFLRGIPWYHCQTGIPPGYSGLKGHALGATGVQHHPCSNAELLFQVEELCQHHFRMHIYIIYVIYDDLWWFVMIYDDLSWFVMICHDLWWSVMIYGYLWSWFLKKGEEIDGNHKFVLASTLMNFLGPNLKCVWLANKCHQFDPWEKASLGTRPAVFGLVHLAKSDQNRRPPKKNSVLC